jgi:hypothetical protein
MMWQSEFGVNAIGSHNEVVYDHLRFGSAAKVQQTRLAWLKLWLGPTRFKYADVASQ